MSATEEGNHSSLSSDTSINNHNVHQEEVEEEMQKPPDGGWGWVVVFCSFMIHVIVDGMTYTFGIFYMEFLKHFGESKGATSWVASIMVGTTLCVGPFASGLTNQFGCRTVTIIGSILASFGLIISTFAPNITFLYFSIGICTGTGFGLMYLPAIVCVTCYFEKRRSFATGIAVCGSGIGTFFLAPVIEWMVSVLGWQGAMLITAGFVLNCCVFGALFRPLESKQRVVRRMTTCSFSYLSTNGDLKKGSLPNGTIGSNGEVCLVSLKVENLKKQSSLLGINNPAQNVSSNHQIRNAASMTLSCGNMSSCGSSIQRRSGPLPRKDVFYSGSMCGMPACMSNLCLYDVQLEPEVLTELAKTSTKTKILNCLCPATMQDVLREMMNFRLMSDVIFLIFAFSNFFTNFGFDVPYLYTKDRAIGLGLAEEDFASYLLSVIGIANTIGRVILGYLSDRSCINRLWLYSASLMLCGLATTFSSFCSNYNLMALYAAVFGATAGAYVSLTSVILVDLLGLDKLTNALGLLLLFEGIASLIGPPITGWLHDYTGSYDLGFYVSGGMIAFSGLMLFFIPCVQCSTDENVWKKSQKTEIQLSPFHSETAACDSGVKEQVWYNLNHNKRINIRPALLAYGDVESHIDKSADKTGKTN